jgi:Flp pilus assembly pilin Flp
VVTTLTTYDDGSLLEDVMLSVTNISPEDRPFSESIGKKRATQPIHQWPEDTLATRASAATQEGATISASTVVAPSRLTNYTEYMTKTWLVTNTEIASKGAGIDDMFMYQRGKRLKELANSIEYDLINSTVSAGLTTATRTMSGMVASMTTNISNATGQTFTETGLVSLFSLAWTSGGNPKKIFVNGTLKSAITKFASQSGTLQKQISAEKLTTVNAVDFYVNDFTGRAEVMLSRDMPNGTSGKGCAVIDESLFSAAYLIPIRDVEVGQTTFGKLGALETELTLECRAQKGNAYMYNLVS